MKAILILILSCFVTLITAQTRINELPAKTNADSTWLILTGNPSSGKLYKMSFDHLKDSVIGEVGTTIDTTSLSNRIDSKLNASDTASLSLRIDAITGGSGGGESIDSTLSIGNTTNALMIFNHDYNFNASTGIKHDQDPLIPLGTNAGYNLKLIETSEYGVNAAVGRWQENISEYQTGQEGTPTARKNVVWSFGYNIDQGIANEGYMRLGMESNYRPGGGAEWFEWHAPEVMTRDGAINRWYSITGNKGYPSATHLFHGNAYTFFDIANYPAYMLSMTPTVTSITATEFNIFDSDGDGSRVHINHNDPAGDIYVIFDGVGTGGRTYFQSDNPIYFYKTIETGNSYGTSVQFNSASIGSAYHTSLLKFMGEDQQIFRIQGTRVNASNDVYGGITMDDIAARQGSQIYLDNRSWRNPLSFFTKPAGGGMTHAGSISADSSFWYFGAADGMIPTQRVHVAGNARITGAIYDSNNEPGTSGQILSSTVTGTDWVNAPTGTVTGTGTTNYVSKWTSETALGISNISDNGTTVSIGTGSPDSSAIFTINSSTQGFLPPRITKTQRDAISSPATGLMVYQTDNTPGLRVFNGTNWMRYTETAD